jgi:hypothetical protein
MPPPWNNGSTHRSACPVTWRRNSVIGGAHIRHRKVWLKAGRSMTPREVCLISLTVL